MEWIHKTDTQILLNVKVKRFARLTGVFGERGGWLEIGVSNPPEKGKANKALLKYLGKKIGVPATDLRIIRGTSSTQKVIAFPKIIPVQEVVRRLQKEIA